VDYLTLNSRKQDYDDLVYALSFPFESFTAAAMPVRNAIWPSPGGE
jgi:hypothetical protein